MKKNEKVVMLIEVVDFGDIPFYELYEDVAYGYERYKEMWGADNILSLNYVYIMEHMLKDYYAVWQSIDNLDEDDLYYASDRVHRKMEMELACIWNKLHK